MRKLKFISKTEKAYSGYDERLERPVTVEAGGVVECSEEKAEQLFRDFPNDWETVQSPAPKGKGK